MRKALFTAACVAVKAQDECTTVPAPCMPVEIYSDWQDCNKIQMSVSIPSSCSPVLKTETECADSTGVFRALPQFSGAFNSWTIYSNHFRKAPFNLKFGDQLNCRARSSNVNGWGAWSQKNQAYAISECNNQQNNAGGWGGSCPCKRSCRATGCGGCCGNQGQQGGNFWQQAADKGCCAMGTCECGQLGERQHRHKYCHVHEADKNKFRSKTRWEMQTKKRTQEVLAPFKKTVKRIKLERQVVKQKVTKYETKTITAKETVMVKRPKKMITVTVSKKKVMRPKYRLVKKTEWVKKTEMRPTKKSVSKIVMKKEQVMRPFVKYELQQQKRKGTRMVEEKRMVKKTVPKNVQVPLIPLPGQNAVKEAAQLAKEFSCPCYQAQCACEGQAGCGCCQPLCACAPAQITAAESETIEISVPGVIKVPQDFIETVSIEVPKLVEVPEEIEIPTEEIVEETVNVPHVVKVEQEYLEPVIEMEEVEIEVPEEVETTIMVDTPVEIEVLREVKVPVTVEVAVEKEIPVEVDQEITELRTVEKEIEVTEPVAVTYQEKIATPPCHWHDITHKHSMKAGLTHTHRHKQD